MTRSTPNNWLCGWIGGMAGNPHALTTVRVPTPAGERSRIESRQWEQLKWEMQRMGAQGRSLLLTPA